MSPCCRRLAVLFLGLAAIVQAPPVRAAGARILTGLRENLRLPRLTRGVENTGFFLENHPIPFCDQDYDAPVMSPHHAGCIVEVTRDQIMQSNPEIEALVGQILNEFDADKRLAMLIKLHELESDRAVMIWVVHDLNPRALSPKLHGFVQAQNWFQDLTPITVDP